MNVADGLLSMKVSNKFVYQSGKLEFRVVQIAFLKLKKLVKLIRWLLIALLGLIFIGLLIPQNFKNPVIGASSKDYNQDSFWYYPWGKSITHKGVDIFAKKDTPIVSSTNGIVLYTGEIRQGGNVILILGPKWRVHYYAHLEQINCTPWSMVNQNITIGSVGNSGNAKGKPAHLHYSIITLIPYLWQIDDDRQGWKKMFYLNPIEFLNQ